MEDQAVGSLARRVDFFGYNPRTFAAFRAPRLNRFISDVGRFAHKEKRDVDGVATHYLLNGCNGTAARATWFTAAVKPYCDRSSATGQKIDLAYSPESEVKNQFKSCNNHVISSGGDV